MVNYKMNKILNNLKKIFLLVAFALFTICVSNAQTSRYNFSNASIQRSDDGKSVELAFDASPNGSIKSQEIVFAFPALVSADGSKRVEIEPFQVAGPTRYRVINRMSQFGNMKDTKMPPITNLYSKSSAMIININKTIPYESWMKNSYLVVKEQVYGCAECGVDESLSQIAKSNIPSFTPEDYIYKLTPPEKVARKFVEDSVKCKVNYVVNKSNLIENFKNNKEELALLRQFIDRMKGYTGATIDEFNLKGSASPEAPMDHNLKLSTARANSLMSYIDKNYPNLNVKEHSTATGIGEDWDGLYELVAESDLSNKLQIMEIIKKYDTDIPREKEIKALDGGKTYNKLLNDIYPSLRYTSVKIKLSVRPYTDEELEGVYKQNPKLLSSYELYTLANQLEKRGTNPVSIYKTALDQENNLTNRINYATALLKYDQNAKGAIEVLEMVKNEPTAQFPLAMAYNMLGNEDEAEEILRKMANNGDEKAKQILGIK